MRATQRWLASSWDHSPACLVRSVQVTPVLLGAIGVCSHTVWLLQGIPLFSPISRLFTCVRTVSWKGVGRGGMSPPAGETSLTFGEDLLDPSTLSLRNVGGQVCTPIFQVGDTVMLGDVGSQVSSRTLLAGDTVSHCTPFATSHMW